MQISYQNKRPSYQSTYILGINQFFVGHSWSVHTRLQDFGPSGYKNGHDLCPKTWGYGIMAQRAFAVCKLLTWGDSAARGAGFCTSGNGCSTFAPKVVKAAVLGAPLAPASCSSGCPWLCFCFSAQHNAVFKKTLFFLNSFNRCIEQEVYSSSPYMYPQYQLWLISWINVLHLL